MTNGTYETIIVDKNRLTEMCKRAYKDYIERRRIFKNGVQEFLPQLKLPEDMEYSPKRTETRKPKQAANYLWTLASLERRAQTRVNIRNGRKAWKNQNSRWIFDPKQVAERSLKDIKRIFKTEFNYTLQDFPSNYKDNASRLIESYEGDPRKIINGKTVEQSREELMKFDGIGTGIANLIIFYYLDRKLASPLDPENTLLKVDVHKSRIPINTEGVDILNGETIRRDSLVPILESVYSQICGEGGLTPAILDAALWIIGSEICVKKNYSRCVRDCPLEEICTSCVPEDPDRGRFIVYQDGKRVETREEAKKNKHTTKQTYLRFLRED